MEPTRAQGLFCQGRQRIFFGLIKELVRPGKDREEELAEKKRQIGRVVLTINVIKNIRNK